MNCEIFFLNLQISTYVYSINVFNKIYTENFLKILAKKIQTKFINLLHHFHNHKPAAQDVEHDAFTTIFYLQLVNHTYSLLIVVVMKYI